MIKFTELYVNTVAKGLCNPDERVVAAGAGIGLLPDQFSADSVRQAVQALLYDEAYRNAAQGIAREIAAMPGAARAVVALERLVTRA